MFSFWKNITDDNMKVHFHLHLYSLLCSWFIISNLWIMVHHLMMTRWFFSSVSPSISIFQCVIHTVLCTSISRSGSCILRRRSLHLESVFLYSVISGFVILMFILYISPNQNCDSGNTCTNVDLSTYIIIQTLMWKPLRGLSCCSTIVPVKFPWIGSWNMRRILVFLCVSLCVV